MGTIAEMGMVLVMAMAMVMVVVGATVMVMGVVVVLIMVMGMVYVFAPLIWRSRRLCKCFISWVTSFKDIISSVTTPMVMEMVMEMVMAMGELFIPCANANSTTM